MKKRRRTINKAVVAVRQDAPPTISDIVQVSRAVETPKPLTVEDIKPAVSPVVAVPESPQIAAMAEAPGDGLELEAAGGAEAEAAPAQGELQSTAPAVRVRRRLPLWLRWPAVAIVLAAVAYGSFLFVYKDRIYPGVTAHGLNISGMTQEEAAAKLADRVEKFGGAVVSIRYGNTVMRIPVNGLDVSYDTAKVAAAAYKYGRQGGLRVQFEDQVNALIGKTRALSSYGYADDKLLPYLVQINEDVLTPAANATLKFNGQSVTVEAGTAGQRLEVGRLVRLVEARLDSADDAEIAAPVYSLAPQVDTEALVAARARAKTMLSAPIDLLMGQDRRTISQETIIGWLKVNRRVPGRFIDTYDLADIYPRSLRAGLAIEHQAVVDFVSGLAKEIDRAPRNAALAMENGHVAVRSPSVDGAKLNQEGAVKEILAALEVKDTDGRLASIRIDSTRADVREDNLDKLGIKELVSEGVTYFPGSTQARLTNVRVGAARFNGVVLAPGQVFSFGALLGDVGPETGYLPELVILDNHEEKQYGGGLCQVSSTAFRAALLAGMPILERHNHAFAISYYTAPYGVPGVDATIYYPQLDFKFKNDTGSYVLIQTIMEGTTLKFQYYGTKVKSGAIRGPFFVTGNSDSTKPSHTVFYRDVLTLDGAVTSTDTFDTYYQSSRDFPIQKQFN